MLDAAGAAYACAVLIHHMFQVSYIFVKAQERFTPIEVDRRIRTSEGEGNICAIGDL